VLALPHLNAEELEKPLSDCEKRSARSSLAASCECHPSGGNLASRQSSHWQRQSRRHQFSHGNVDRAL